MSIVVPKKVDWDNLEVPVWQRLPGETSRAFHCWTVYRDMPNAERTIENAARKEGVTVHAFRDHSIRWHWSRRLEAWENYLDATAIKNQLEAAKEMDTRHVRSMRLLLDKAMLRLTGREPDEHGRGGIQALPIEALSASDVTRMAELAMKYERIGLEAEARRLGIDQGPPEDPVVVVKLAFDATPQQHSGSAFHGATTEEDVIDGEAREVEPAGLPAADGVGDEGALEGAGGDGA